MYEITREAIATGEKVRFGNLIAERFMSVVDVWTMKNGKKIVICDKVSEHTATIRILEILGGE